MGERLASFLFLWGSVTGVIMVASPCWYWWLQSEIME